MACRCAVRDVNSFLQRQAAKQHRVVSDIQLAPGITADLFPPADTRKAFCSLAVSRNRSSESSAARAINSAIASVKEVELPVL